MTTESFSERIRIYCNAGYSILYIVSPEEARAESDIYRTYADPKANKKALFIWSHTDGMIEMPAPGAPANAKAKIDPMKKDPKAALEAIKALCGTDDMPPTLYVFRDLHPFMSASPAIVRLLRDLSRDLRSKQSTLIILSPVSKIPPELTRDVVQIEYALPNRDEIANTWDTLYKQNEKAFKAANITVDADQRDMIVSSAMGLTTVEAESAFSMALVNRNRGSIPKLVLQEKAVAVRKTGILEYSEPGTSLDDIGGLEILKKWVIKRKSAFTRDAREYGLPTPKGILLVGVPGGGKSLAAKCISTGLDVPLIRFDIARVFAGLVGESESQMRNALQFIDGVGPCVVWVDEMEKAFAGAGGSGSNDSGVTKRVFGNFLTWMQEKTAPSFVVATCNSIEGIPPEMLRKGRFDENFYVGVPTNKGRIEISRIMANKFAKNGNIQHEIVAKASAQYTGAEIEAAYQEAMFTVYDEGKRPMVTDDVCRAIKNMNPITKAFALEIGNMLKWAQDNAVNASLLDDAAGPAKVESGGRVLTLA